MDPRSRELNSNTVSSFVSALSLSVPNKILYTWRGDYCECVRPSQLPVLTEVRSPFLLEQHPRHVLHRDSAGYNSVSKVRRSLNVTGETTTEFTTDYFRRMLRSESFFVFPSHTYNYKVKVKMSQHMPWRQTEWKCRCNKFEPQHYVRVSAQRHATTPTPPAMFSKKAPPWQLNRSLWGLRIRCRESNCVFKIAHSIA
jgi:hypothetical protein